MVTSRRYALTLAFGLTLAGAAPAQSGFTAFTFVGLDPTDPTGWDRALNWDPAGSPGRNPDPAATCSVTINGSTVRLTTFGPGVVSNVGVEYMTMNGGTLTLATDDELSATGRLAFSNLTFNAGSTVALDGGGLTCHPFQAQVNNAGTVRGRGFLGKAGLPINFDNRTGGEVIADHVEQPLTINLGFARNTGTLRATGGGGLIVVGGTLLNVGGTVQADAGATTRLATTVRGGTLTTVGSGVISWEGLLDGSTDLVSNFGNLKTTLSSQLQGGLLNFGRMTAADPNVTTLAGNVGNLGGANLTIRNGQHLTLENISNAGTVDIRDASILTVSGDYTQTGGTTNVADPAAALNIGGVLSLAGGTFTGLGTVTTPQVSVGAAALSPGASPGRLNLSANLTMSGESTLDIEIGGTGQGTTYDLLNASGSAALGGATLGVSFFGGFENSVLATDTFTILAAAGGLSGTFAGLPHGSRVNTADGFGSFRINYVGNGVVLSQFAPVPEPGAVGLAATAAWGLVRLWRGRRDRRDVSAPAT